MRSPTACGAVFSASTTPQPSWNPGGTLVELWWNPGGEPWWNPRGTLPQGHPGPPRSLSWLRPRGKTVYEKHKRWGLCPLHNKLWGLFLTRFPKEKQPETNLFWDLLYSLKNTHWCRRLGKYQKSLWKDTKRTSFYSDPPKGHKFGGLPRLLRSISRKDS